MLDLLIVGAGPAGVSAALWAQSLELSHRVLERSEVVGGQLHLIRFHPKELVGLPEGSGPEIAAVCNRQLEALGTDLRRECPAENLELGPPPAVVDPGGARHGARAVLIATGARRRRLGIPGEDALEGRGVSYSARKDGARFAGERAIVVGGGDGAYENALMLAEVGCPVTIVARGAPRARAAFQARAAEKGIEVLPHARVTGFVGTHRLEAVRLATPDGETERPVRAAVIKVGMVPNTEWCRGIVECDAAGYLRTRAHGRTSAASVWACGDLARPRRPSLAAAIGGAAEAVEDIRVSLTKPHPPG